MQKTFKINYSVLKKNKLVYDSIIIHSAKEKNEVTKSATLDISTKERVFVQHVKILSLKPIRLI